MDIDVVEYHNGLSSLQSEMIDFAMKYSNQMPTQLTKSFQVIRGFVDNELQKTEMIIANNLRKR